MACGGSGSPPPSTAPAASTAAPEAPPPSSAPPASSTPPAPEKVVGPPDVKWTDMTPEQKGKYMAAVVVPRMKELFVGFDSKEFATFDCATCHGKDAKQRAFKMPNPGIYALPADAAGFGKLMKDKPEWMKFMGEKVKPEMAKLLALQEMDPKKPQPGTFGCGNCHTTKK
jgi:hypothetical protein